MAERPACVEEWFDRLPQLLSPQGWEVASDRHGTLSHCPCPWGGRLIKITLDGIAIKDPPRDTSHVLVRPEVRAQFLKDHPEYSAAGYGVFGFELVNHLAPGDAVVKTWALWSLFRLCTVLFGQLSTARYAREEAGSARQRLVRDFPKDGDCSYTHTQDFGEIRDVLLICRPTRMLDAYDVQVIFSVHEDRFAHWAVPQFVKLLESARKSTEWFLNRPGVHQLRQMDEEFYTILAIQSWQRGPPFLPNTDGSPTVTIDAGEKLGLTSWARFHPPQEKFLFSQYLQLFLEALLGEKIDVYSTLDGRQLVPYQAAVLRQQWLRIRTVFNDAFSLQKTAYRRANGGTTAPNVHEDVKARFLPHHTPLASVERCCLPQEPPQHKVVVRRTFLEVETETDDEEFDFDCSERHGRRHRTVNPLCTDRSGLE